MYQLWKIAELANAKNRAQIDHSDESVFDREFDLNQRKILYEILLRIEENVQQTGVMIPEFLDSDIEVD